MKQNTVIKESDSTLVMCSLGGDRNAFCEIVTRYQTLLCSLAYSSVGDIKQSEDISQEAFVEAWKKLDTLREPEKLKSWLCGILRFKVSHYRRKEDKYTGKNAEALQEETLKDNQQGEMDDQAIQQQHEALLWQALDDMEQTYREPLILFYREQQSVERVASELDLSVDTAKQRLSRGRKLLKKAMSSFVEDALKNSTPGVAFTTVVISAISGISPPAKAAAFGAGAANAGSILKMSTLLPLVAASSGFISSFFGVRAGLDQSRTERERKLVIKVAALFISIAIVYVLGVLGLEQIALMAPDNALFYAWASQGLLLAFVMIYGFLTYRMVNVMRTIRVQERIFHPEAFTDRAAQKNSKQTEYKSKLSLLGIPVFHFQFGTPEEGYKPAYGWFAGGSYAYGLLFAWGGVAIAPISVGIVSVGVITVGAVGIGILSAGTVALGFFGFGASAVAFKAYSSLSSLGWESAVSGGFAIAKEAAIGNVAFAQHANTEKAAELTQLTVFAQNYQWALAAIALLVIVPAAWHSHKVRQRMKKID